MATPTNPTNGTIYIPNVVTTSNWYTITIPAQPTTPSTIQLDLPTEVTEKKKDSVGCHCTKCSEFNEYATANQPDDTFMCYRCRHNL